MRSKLAVWTFLLAVTLVAGCASAGGPAGLPNPNPNPSSGGSTPTPVPTGKVALNDLGAGSYLGFEGGLYPNGANNPPPAHDTAGMAHAALVQPLDVNGNASAGGKIVVMSIGMSNTTDEWCSNGGACTANSFTGQANAGGHNAKLVIADGAYPSQDAKRWIDPTACLTPPPPAGECNNYDRVRDLVLTPLGLTEKQVQAIWLKEADEDPTVSLPSSSADAYVLEGYLGQIIRAAKVRYPHLQFVFLSSRIYGGYATTPLNPEPYAYESGFADKWTIGAQITQMSGGGTDPIAGNLNYNDGTAPWIGWSAYLWANGTTPRSDGTVWCNGQAGPPCSGAVDFQSDGTHPATSGVQKVGAMLLNFFKTSPYTASWFN
jgi:hypothetical protein